MKNEPQSAELGTPRRSLVALALLSLLVGAAAGGCGAAFRLALNEADRFRGSLLVWAHEERFAGFLIVVFLAAVATGLAAWLVNRFSPQAAGSGIPQVEAQLHGGQSGSPFRIIPVKFLAGLLAIGAGLALGREGPTVQMGASLAQLLGKLFRRSEDDCRALLAAGAGAGLATAFNAPIAGAVFVLEELVRRFDLPITIATLGASAGAISVARLMLGQAPDFRVQPFPYPGFGILPSHLALGVIAGLVGVAYSRAILGALAVAHRLSRFPAELRASAVGAAVGALAWFMPDLVGGGNAITQRLLGGNQVLFAFGLPFAIRFGLGAVSYAARTPGGLFAPMLALGAQFGLLFGTLCSHWFPLTSADPHEYAVVAIAALFTAVVRAPLTGIILAIELTGSFTLLLPMLGACFAGMLVPTLLRTPPIYDSLTEPAPTPAQVPAAV